MHKSSTEAKPQKKTAAAAAPRKSGRMSSGARTAIIAAAAALAVLLAGFAGFGIYVTNTDTVFPGVRVGGVLVGGLTENQAADALSAAGWDGNGSVSVALPLDHVITVTAEEAGAAVDAAGAAYLAYDYCHGGNIFSNAVKYIKCWFSGGEVDLAVKASESAVKTRVEAEVSSVTAQLMASGTEQGEDTITVVKGARAVSIDADEITSMMVAALNARDYGEKEYKVEINESAELDIAGLHESVFAEAADAYYDAETGAVVDAVRGVDFDTDEAQRLWDAAGFGESVEIPLIITEPAITTEALNAMLFRDELSAATTSLSGSSANRINNVTLAAKSINGKVLKPGETFSYNETLGQRTEKNGYKAAGAYSGGQVVQEIGGGICQVSSTLYYCSLLANLKINTRTCHYFPVGYLPPGLDATVSWKTPDFKFTNSRDYPIRIEASVDTKANTVTVKLIGTNVDGSYVKMTYASWEVFNNAKYPDIATGYKAATYRCVYDKNDNLLSKELEAYSEYRYHEEDIKYPEESPSPSPSPSAAPTPTATPSPAASAAPTETPGSTTAPTATPAPLPTWPAGT